MSSALALKKITAVKLTVVGGDDAATGQSFVFDKAMITIGRGTDNDVSFAHDPKMSRNHVELQIYGDRLFVRNISQKNMILLDNEKIQEKAITGTAVLQVGSMSLEIKLAMADGAKQTPKVQPPPPPPVAIHIAKAQLVQRPRPEAGLAQKYEPKIENKYEEKPVQNNSKNNSKLRSVAQSGSRANLYIIVVIIGIFMFWLLTDNAAKKKSEINIRTEADITRAIEDSAKAVQELQTSQSKAGQDTIQYKASQEHYIKGFRDYRQGQYSRAQQSFQAALSLYPAHELARKYYVQSQRKFEEQLDRTMSQGRKYYQKNNFRMCQSAFAGAMIMLKDSSKAKYKESKQLYDECSLRLEGRF